MGESEAPEEEEDEVALSLRSFINNNGGNEDASES